MRYTETKVYDIQRQGDMNVDSVARNALKKANSKADQWCSALPSE
mgnify:CR=1 FL=1